ncbi:hypothetical protein P8853_10040 [Bacillus haynesii]|uniref:hypothetical protein n=1 Tax=Bacillus haynesii TaxID=1925021 RepID=UPI002DBF45BA|nr:hypothetical protein [Bacillus haynesii]
MANSKKNPDQLNRKNGSVDSTPSRIPKTPHSPKPVTEKRDRFSVESPSSRITKENGIK